MPTEWKQETLQAYIDDGVQESQRIEYKAAEALGKSDPRKIQITKDVSAMANAAGGIIIYGMREHDAPEKRHLPEKLDGIDRTIFTREWLDQVINGVEPRINGLVIHPVELDIGHNLTAYVVEIPQSSTAHQARDYRYYRRYNFECLRMHDHEVRDVMNRATTPSVDVRFAYATIGAVSGALHEYRLAVVITNQGVQVVNHYKLEFTFPNIDLLLSQSGGWISLGSQDEAVSQYLQIEHNDSVEITEKGLEIHIKYRSENVLFPADEEDLSQAIGCKYYVDTGVYHRRWEMSLKWTVYADHMPPKSGEVPFSDLMKF